MSASSTSSDARKMQPLRIPPARKPSSSAISPTYHDGAPLRTYTPMQSPPCSPTYRDGAPLASTPARGDGHTPSKTPYTPLKAFDGSKTPKATQPDDYFGCHAASGKKRDDTNQKTVNTKMPQTKSE
ncbi:hypothetical protein CYLTODRAFT_421514 [Cylindrobasidium torrendii FP15055 ss-10]|uniref:Uncharacterized protein n=1 Tax=Cylindrobasidium torrendii FP15055 ss-10 TaxID=1314674 RepID=A0A0D7BEK8_9AGAR|nr:hypothetical protein CYLTODRAFT_421514 [Cylindrobasidium torrendii FP15055 ss-10]